MAGVTDGHGGALGTDAHHDRPAPQPVLAAQLCQLAALLARQSQHLRHHRHHDSVGALAEDPFDLRRERVRVDRLVIAVRGLEYREHPGQVR